MALSPDSYKALLLSINPSIREQFNAQQQYWREKYSPLLGSLQSYMYDLMLKGNKISSGTKNYLQVIDLIMAMDNKLLTLQQTKTFYHEKDFIGFGHYGCGGGCAGAGSAAKL
jgi:hypothetical protein